MTPEKIAELRASRGSVYGDPYENHAGIGLMWASLLQPHARDILDGHGVPAHTVALCMMALKLNRMRRVFHQDNYDDSAVYATFAAKMQKDYKPPERKVQRIYVAGPYTASTPKSVNDNVSVAASAASRLMEKGHLAHCPHTATHEVDAKGKARGFDPGYEAWMTLDFSLIRYWATALLYMGPSAGADRELALAKDLGLTIYYSLDEVPDNKSEYGGRPFSEGIGKIVPAKRWQDRCVLVRGNSAFGFTSPSGKYRLGCETGAIPVWRSENGPVDIWPSIEIASEKLNEAGAPPDDEGG